jgi:predicted enzyme related to lactoylglutathione lyase
MSRLTHILLRVVAAGGLLLAASAATARTIATPDLAVGAQYDTTHVYVSPDKVDAFVNSLIQTFGGKSTPQAIATVTPTPSSTSTQLVFTPVGTFSVFGFRTPVPAPFGSERTGYLVTDMDAAVRAARDSGAEVIVAPFPDPIGRDTVIRWSGGVKMQLYWHTTAPHYDALKTIPENRVYVSADRADRFVKDFVRFSHGHVVSDVAQAPGVEIGRPDSHYRRVQIESGFGKLTVLVTDGHLPYPYGHELTGYEVSDLASTLEHATQAGARVLIPPYEADQRQAAMVEFPGGYIAEIHAPLKHS